MPDTTRTFIAVTPPEPLWPRLGRLQASLAAEIAEARWSVTPPYHITLAYLGDVPHADLAGVCQAATTAAAAFPPIELSLSGVGAFPNPARPRVFWVGVTGDGLETLLALQSALARATAAVGYPADDRPFRPHLTIGQMKPSKGKKAHVEPRDVSKLLHVRRSWAAGPFRVTEAVTFGSTMTKEGPAYARLGSARLTARPRTGINP